MATNSNILPLRTVVSVVFPNFKDKGFGWDGSFTREAWRKACLDNFLAGKDHFEAWQASWKDKISNDLANVSYQATLIYDDGSQQPALTGNYSENVPYILDFTAHTFKDNVNANDFTFEQATYFHRATFVGTANFQHSTFKLVANFYDATFIKDAYFLSATTFIGSAIFKGATFAENGYFSGAMFGGVASFQGAIFKHSADFSDTKITGAAYFRGTEFEGTTYFKKTTFTGDAEFTDATFTLDAFFCGVTFTKEARFINVTFTGVAGFNNATFSGDAYFISATFSGDAYFRRATFDRQCRFDNTFNNAKNEWTPESSFTRRADFENALFKNVGHFERTCFKSHTPTFRGCQIDSTRLEFSDDSYFPRDEKDENAIKNISFLKRLSDEHGQTDQALNFNAMELRAKRLQTEPKSATWSFKAVTWFYEILSDSGRSFTRPIIFYALLIWLSFLYAYGHIDNTTEASISNSKLCEPKPLNLSREKAAVEYAMFRAGGLMDFTDTGKQNNAVNCRLFEEPIEPPLMRAWGIFKGIASIALLFLAALGLRNKYRIK